MYPTFTGKSRKTRNVNLSGQNLDPFKAAWSPSNNSGASKTVAAAQADRHKRQQEKDRLHATHRIQRTWRGHIARRRLKDARRQAFDETYGQDIFADHQQRLATALPLLLAAFDQKRPDDIRRLISVADSLTASDIEEFALAKDQRTLSRMVRLARALMGALEQGETDSRLIELLAYLASVAPLSLSNSLDRYYKALGQLSSHPDARNHIWEPTQRAILAPLQAPRDKESFLAQAYMSFAIEYLTLSNLCLFEHEIDLFAQLLHFDSLSSAVLKAYYSERIHSNDSDGLLWLLAHSIDLHKSTPGKDGHSVFLKSLHIQLQHLAPFISLRYPLTSAGTGLSASGGRAQREKSSQPLPTYVANKIGSLVDRDGITALLTELTQSTQHFEGASLLAGYIITLLRCFPAHGDDIRMRLFLGDVPSGNGQTPVVKFLWASMGQTQLYSQIIKGRKSATIGLVRKYLSQMAGAQSPDDQEWRLVLLFLELYIFILRLSDDDDFFSCIFPRIVEEEDNQAPSRLRSCGLSMEEIQSLSKFLKNLAFVLHHNAADVVQNLNVSDDAFATVGSSFGAGTLIGISKEKPSSVAPKQESPLTRPDLGGLRSIVTSALRMLYERDSRRPFLPRDHWLMTSEFDMGRFVDTVVLEQQRQEAELAQAEDVGEEEEEGEEEEGEGFGDGDIQMGGVYGIHSHTSAGQRLSRHAQIESLRARQRKAHKDRMLSIIGPKLEVLKHMPFVIPFATRVEIFRKFVESDKIKRREGMDAETWRMSMINNPLMPLSNSHAGKYRAQITRGQEFDDAYEQLYDLDDKLKEPIQVQFVDKWGEVEAGIDGGGVTKEFLISAIDQAFSSSEEDYFATNKQGLIFPNPVVIDRVKDLMAESEPAEIHEQVQELLRRFEFLGRIVGKCMYEGILVDINFAGFFLLKWASGQTGENSYRGNVNDLRDMDEELYQGMLKLKNYRGNIADWGLDFVIEDQISGADEPVKTITRKLIPNGEDVPVTNDNRLLYISYVARHRLVAQPAQQTAAFLCGLRAMIAPSWLSMFNQSELQRLVGGDSSEIDIDDLRRNTIYSGLYDPGYGQEDHPTILLFWKVLRAFTDAQRRLLLKYVTSTPRAPLLGFSQLSPRFSIRDAGSDQERLPSTSTCVNLLKLPKYQDEETLRKKLVQAIESGAGFDLS